MLVTGHGLCHDLFGGKLIALVKAQQQPGRAAEKYRQYRQYKTKQGRSTEI
jgi:hypothetical protein